MIQGDTTAECELWHTLTLYSGAAALNAGLGLPESSTSSAGAGNQLSASMSCQCSSIQENHAMIQILIEMARGGVVLLEHKPRTGCQADALLGVKSM